jgi:hypothetical protein
MYHTSYFGFGALIAENAYEDIELVEKFEYEGEYNGLLKSWNVGWLMAGHYDRDKLFLTTFCESVDLGDYKQVDPTVEHIHAAVWTDSLKRVSRAIGRPLLETPGWFFIPDLS